MEVLDAARAAAKHAAVENEVWRRRWLLKRKLLMTD
jgi:hypothetical protein